jgi:flavin reductase (DIM6/NTAB) family NADH-FMN oxidoreductase RutF
MSEWFVEAANHTCGVFEADTDEMALAGLTAVPSLRVKPPRVGESAVHMECQLASTYEVKNEASGLTTATIVIGKVVMMHINEGVASRSPSGNVTIDAEKYQSISRLGGITYGRTAGCFDLPRP